MFPVPIVVELFEISPRYLKMNTVSDMVLLESLTEETIINNVKERYSASQIYVNFIFYYNAFLL